MRINQPDNIGIDGSLSAKQLQSNLSRQAERQKNNQA